MALWVWYPNGTLIPQTTSFYGSSSDDNPFYALKAYNGYVYLSGTTTGSLNGPNQGSTDEFIAKIQIGIYCSLFIFVHLYLYICIFCVFIPELYIIFRLQLI